MIRVISALPPSHEEGRISDLAACYLLPVQELSVRGRIPARRIAANAGSSNGNRQRIPPSRLGECHDVP